MKNLKRKHITGLLWISLIALTALPLILYSQEIGQEVVDALAVGDTTRAINLLEKDISLDPSYEYNYYTLGLIYLEQKKLDKAETEFANAVEKNSKFWPGVYELGKVKLKRGKIEEAEKLFEQGMKKGKKYKAQFLNGMGLLYIAKGEYDKADTDLRKAIVEEPDNAEYHINLGDANYYMGVYYSATSEYQKALELDTASLGVYFRWAEACIELKDYSCALEKLSVVLQKDSTHADAWFDAGGIYYKAARSSRDIDEIKELYGKTIGSYQKYMELSQAAPDSSNGRAFYETGKSYLMLGGFAEAQENLARILSIPIYPKDIFYYYGRSFHGINAYDSAIYYYKKHDEWVDEQGPDFSSGISDDELYRRIGECYESLANDYRRADPPQTDKASEANFNTITYYKKSLEIDSTQDRLLYGVAVAYNYLLDYRNAVIYYMKRIALGIDERQWIIYYNAATSALALAEKGSMAMEDELEDLGLEDEFDVPPANDPLADVDLVDVAIGYLEKIANDHWDYVFSNERYIPVAMRTLSMLGSAYLFQKMDCANGVKYFERVLEIEPENCEALRSLGFAYYGGICPENYTKAIDYLNKALNCNLASGKKRCDDIDLLLWIGQAYENRAFAKSEAKKKEEAKADYKIADDYYTECLKCDPNNQDCKDGQRRVKWEH